MHLLSIAMYLAITALLVAGCDEREGSPFDIKFKRGFYEHPGTADYDPSHWQNLALGNLLKLRTPENKEELERAIQYLAKINCGGGDRQPIDIDTFYPMHLLPQMYRVFCGEFQLKNHNTICGSGPKARGKCVDVIYTDYDESEYFK